jgi:hypothetical protein
MQSIKKRKEKKKQINESILVLHNLQQTSLN